MVCVDEAFSAENTAPIRLDSFLALFDLLLCHKFDLHPIIRIILRKVMRVLSLVQNLHMLLWLLCLVSSQIILRSCSSFGSQILHLLCDELIHTN